MSRTWPIVVGLCTLSTLACREPKESPTPAPAGSAGSAGRAAISAPAAPSLPTVGDAVQTPASAGSASTSPTHASFEAQQRDPAWAPKVEQQIRERFAKVRGGTLEATECRQNACRLTISGSEGDVGQTIADLESARGLHGFAENITLTAPDRKPDGTVVLRVIASFER